MGRGEGPSGAAGRQSRRVPAILNCGACAVMAGTSLQGHLGGVQEGDAGHVLDVAHGVETLPAVLSAPIDLYYKLFLRMRNGLFEGFFYVALGMMLAVK